MSERTDVGEERSAPVKGASSPILEVVGIDKRFGSIHALQDVSLSIRSGEIHGLVGANGAGKSTLIRILAGVESPDRGEIRLDGQPVTIPTPQKAAEFGLAFIHQELNLVPAFTGFQNMALGLVFRNRAGLIDWKKLRSETARAAKRLNITFPLDVPVEQLTVADRWLISIGKALVRNARLIAMDEPTGSLSLDESERVFSIARDLCSSGIAVLYVSHRLGEIEALCDRVTVFKDGAKVADLEKGSISRPALVRAIVGGDVVAVSAGTRRIAADAPVVLELEDLRKRPAVHGVSLRLHKGEVLGLAGLVGSGRTETARLIFGADAADSGKMFLDGQNFAPRGTWEAAKRGVGLVPEERRTEGLVLTESLQFNVNMASWGNLRRSSRLPLIDHRASKAQALKAVDALKIKATSTSQIVGRLSGGNQQKVVMGKWLVRRPQVLILDEPSRGVDVASRAEIYRHIRNLAADGVGVIVISSEFAELSACDRVLVMSEGRIVDELVGEAIGEQPILQSCYAHQGRHAS